MPPRACNARFRQGSSERAGQPVPWAGRSLTRRHYMRPGCDLLLSQPPTSKPEIITPTTSAALTIIRLRRRAMIPKPSRSSRS